jgi:hypothetical protein
MEVNNKLDVSEEGRSHDTAYLRLLYEGLLSLYFAFVACAVTLALSARLLRLSTRMEVGINHLIGISQSDMIRGYFSILIPSAAVALVLWLLLWASSQSSTTRRILRFGGVFVLFVPAVFWFFVYQRHGWPFGWPYRGAPIELGVAILCTWMFLFRRWPLGWWLSITLLALHYAFFWFRVGGDPYMPNLAGPIMPILGFCSAAVWGLYVVRARAPQDLNGK